MYYMYNNSMYYMYNSIYSIVNWIPYWQACLYLYYNVLIFQTYDNINNSHTYVIKNLIIQAD